MKLITGIIWLISLLQVNVIGMESINLEDFLFSDVESNIVIDFTDTVADIRQQLGDPYDTKVQDFPNFTYVLLDYEYVHIGYLYIDKDSLTRPLTDLFTTELTLRTRRGIAIGSMITEVIDKYGQPTSKYPYRGDDKLGMLVYQYNWVPEGKEDKLPMLLLLYFIHNEDGRVIEIAAERKS